jgi:hypothetical protein
LWDGVVALGFAVITANSRLMFFGFFRDFLGIFYWSSCLEAWERVEPRLRRFDRRGARAEGSQPAPLLVLTRRVAV